MTPEVRKFISACSEVLQGRIIEVGSYDVNGGVRDIVPVAVGTDLREGPGVDLVCPVERLLEHFAPGEFDACVSTETLEHVQDWKGFIRTTWDLVKEGGWIVGTMASVNKGRHAYPDDYWRMVEFHLRTIYPNAAFIGDVGKISIGWAVQKLGPLGNLDEVQPYKVP